MQLPSTKQVVDVEGVAMPVGARSHRLKPKLFVSPDEYERIMRLYRACSRGARFDEDKWMADLPQIVDYQIDWRTEYELVVLPEVTERVKN